MRKLYLIKLLIVVISFSSCQESENVESISKLTSNPYKISVDEAKDIVLDFMQVFQGSDSCKTRTKMRNLEIESVEIVDANKVITRSVGIEDTLLYAVNFSNNGGYVLVGADRRTEPIFGVIDNGSFSEKSVEENPNFAYFLNLALGKAVYDVKTSTTKAVNPGIGDYDNVYGSAYHLTSKWGQGAPYNVYCPGPYTGCVAVAVAQILSYFPVIGNVSWQDNLASGSAILHWNQIQSDCFKNDGRLNTFTTPQSANEIAHLMRYLGVVLKAEYKDDGTSMESKDAINWINDWTSLKAIKLKEYNANEIFMAANFFSNKLVYMRGNRGKNDFLGITIKYTGGHAWVADGAFSARRKSDNKFVNLYHFNWGWDGSNNGYFLATVFDSSNPAIKDSELPGYLSLDDDGTPGNYKYNVEYSVIENPNISGGGTIQ